MKKKDFARELSKLTGEPIVKAEKFISCLHEIIIQEVAETGECILHDVGVFKICEQKPRIRTLPNLTKRATPGRKRVKVKLYLSMEDAILKRHRVEEIINRP